MTMNVRRTVLYYGSIPAIKERVIFSSMVIASLVKPTNGIETLLSWSVGSRIREKIEYKITTVKLPLSAKFFLHHNSLSSSKQR